MVVLLWLCSCCHLNTERRWLVYFGFLLAVILILRGDGCFTLAVFLLSSQYWEEMVVLLWLSSCCHLNTERRWLFYFGCLLAVILILRGDGCFTLVVFLMSSQYREKMVVLLWLCSCCHLNTGRRWLFYFGCLLAVILILREDGCFTLAVFLLLSQYCEKMVVLLWLCSCCHLNTERRWLFFFGCLLAVISILRGDGCFTLAVFLLSSLY